MTDEQRVNDTDGIVIAECILRNNTPIDVWDGVSVSLLGSSDAEAWIDKHMPGIQRLDRRVQVWESELSKLMNAPFKPLVESDDGDVKKKRKTNPIADALAKREKAEDEVRAKFAEAKAFRFSAVVVALKDYAPATFTDPVVAKATVPQVLAAFNKLLGLTDPTSVGVRLGLRAVQQQKTALDIK